MEQMAQVLRDAKIVPVIRSGDGAEALATAQRLLKAGLPVVELTANTPGWAAALEQLREDFPDATLGMGTVVSEEDAVAAIDRGADFLVSPWPVGHVRVLAGKHGIPLLEGGFTPAEIAAAASRGIAKLFPAHVGGPGYLSSIMAVLPQGSLVMPTGGIKLDDAGRWLAAGAVAVGVGKELDRIAQVRSEL